MAEDVQQEQVVEQVQERMLPQSEVNKLVQGAKQNTEAKIRQELEAQYQRQLEEVAAKRQNQQQHAEQGMKPQDNNVLYQEFMERLNRELEEKQLRKQMEEVATNFTARVEQGRKSYDDFSEVTKDFDPGEFPQLVYLLSGLDNGGDVIYELAKNPHKLVTFHQMAKETPRMAKSELLKLSQSISANRAAVEQAKQNGDVPAPLDQIQPSRVSGSNGKASIRDLQSLDWLKG